MIETSAKAGVSELKFGDLHVKFGRPTENIVGMSIPPQYHYPFVQQNPASPSKNDLSEDQHNQQAKESLEVDEIRLREEQLALALVEDPVRYEELLREGELSDDVDSADSEDDE